MNLIFQVKGKHGQKFYVPLKSTFTSLVCQLQPPRREKQTHILKLSLFVCCCFSCSYFVSPNLDCVIDLTRSRQIMETNKAILSFLFFIFCSSTIVSIFTPPCPRPAHPCLLPSTTLPLASMFLDAPALSPIISSPLLSGYHYSALYFNVSACILFACLFC